MSSRFDGAAVLSAIAGHPTVFPALGSEIDAIARKMLLKQLKAASLDLALIVKIVSVVGEPGVRIGFDGMSTKELGAIARRLDPANAEIAGMSEGEIGDHVCALARGDAKPLAGKKAVAPRAHIKRSKKELSKIGEVLNSKVHSGEPPGAKSVKKGGGKKASSGSA